MDTSRQFAETFEAIRPAAGFFEGKSSLYLAAAALTLPTEDERPAPFSGEDFIARVRTFKKTKGWTSPFRTFLRFPLAALTLRHDIEPTALVQAYDHFRLQAKKHKLPRSSTSWLLLAAALHHLDRREPITDEEARRVHDVYRAWKRAHRGQTNASALPLALLHAEHQTPERSTERLTSAYQHLRASKVSHNADRYVAAQILTVLPDQAPEESAARLLELNQACRDRAVRPWKPLSHLAVAALLPLPPDATASRISHLRDELRQRVRKLPKSPATSVAISLTAEEALRAIAPGDLPASAVAMIPHVQALIFAQQAAVAAAVAASTSASAAG